ncbi:MAG: LysR substrate-binding domain-containing protein [Solirubrobacteraceae bacterium]
MVDVAFVRPPFRDLGLSMVTVLTEERFAVLPEDHPLASREEVRPEDVVGEPWIWVEGADPVARAFWSLEEHRGGRPLRTGTRVNSFEEAFGAVAAGLAITCQAESAVRAVGGGFPQLRFVRLGGGAACARCGRLAHRARDRAGARVRARRARGRGAGLTTAPGERPGESVFHIRPSGSQSRRRQPTEGRTSMTTTASLPTDGYLTHQGEPWWFGGSMFEFLVPSDSTGGQITVFRYTAPGGFAPPRHVHTREDEVFHVLEGHVAFEVDGRRQLAGPRDDGVDATRGTARLPHREFGGRDPRADDARAVRAPLPGPRRPGGGAQATRTGCPRARRRSAGRRYDRARDRGGGAADGGGVDDRRHALEVGLGRVGSDVAT